MTFQEPNMLWLALALIPLGLLWRLLSRMRTRRLEKFAEASTWSVLNPHVSTTGRRWKAALIFGAVACSIIAAARPLWGTRERTIRQSGIDILLAVDVSQSMLTRDVDPDRLGQAKTRLRQLLTTFPGQRVGIIPFAGDAFLQCPLTSDYGIALEVLEKIDTRSIGYQGTNLARAIEVAREAFQKGSVGSRVLVMVTDGEQLDGDAVEQARLAATENIQIYALGIGSAVGAPVELPDKTLLVGPDGLRVMSKLDTDTLNAVADATSGKAYIARPGESLDVRPLISELSVLKGGEGEASKRIVREEQFQWPLGLALVLLLLEGILGERRRRPVAAGPNAPVAGGAA